MKNNLNILDCVNNCNECHKKFDFPHNYCCLIECGEHEFCRSCNIKEKTKMEAILGGVKINYPDKNIIVTVTSKLQKIKDSLKYNTSNK